LALPEASEDYLMPSEASETLITHLELPEASRRHFGFARRL